MSIKIKICHNSRSKLDLMEKFAVNAFGKKNVEVYNSRKGYRPCDILISKGIGHDRSNSALSLYQNHIEHHKRKGTRSIIFNKPIKVKGKINRSFIFYIIDGKRVYFSNKKMKSDRWKSLGVQLKPWRSGGDYILFCAQNGRPPFFNKRNSNEDYFLWQNRALEEIRRAVSCDIIYRPHPRGRKPNGEILNFLPSIKKMYISSNENLYDDFSGARGIITYNSTCSVNAIVKGIPTFVMDKNYITKGLSKSSLKFINKNFNEKRMGWFNSFGYCQWTDEEILGDIFWKYTKKYIF